MIEKIDLKEIEFMIDPRTGDLFMCLKNNDGTIGNALDITGLMINAVADVMLVKRFKAVDVVADDGETYCISIMSTSGTVDKSRLN